MGNMDVFSMEQRRWSGNRGPDKTLSGRDRSCQPAWSPLPRPYKASPHPPHTASSQPLDWQGWLQLQKPTPQGPEIHCQAAFPAGGLAGWREQHPSTRCVWASQHSVCSQPAGTGCGWAGGENIDTSAGWGKKLAYCSFLGFLQKDG